MPDSAALCSENEVSATSAHCSPNREYSPKTRIAWDRAQPRSGSGHARANQVTPVAPDNGPIGPLDAAPAMGQDAARSSLGPAAGTATHRARILHATEPHDSRPGDPDRGPRGLW